MRVLTCAGAAGRNVCHVCVVESNRAADSTAAETGASRVAISVASSPVKPTGLRPGISVTVRAPLGCGMMSVSVHATGPDFMRTISASR